MRKLFMQEKEINARMICEAFGAATNQRGCYK
jgi:hypothetical protein